MILIVAILLMEYALIYNLHKKVRYMGKTIYLQYIDAFGNIGVYLPACVAREVWVYTRYPFQYILFATSHVNMKGKVRTIEKDS